MRVAYLAQGEEDDAEGRTGDSAQIGEDLKRLVGGAEVDEEDDEQDVEREAGSRSEEGCRPVEVEGGPQRVVLFWLDRDDRISLRLRSRRC